MSTFVEQSCVIEHNGQQFESGGAWLCDCSDGYRRGVVYAKVDEYTETALAAYSRFAVSYPRRGIVTDWHGNKIADALYGRPYRGGFGAKMRTVSFVLDGVTYTGRYGCDWSEAVRVRSTKKVA